jgi:TonB family protein
VFESDDIAARPSSRFLATSVVAHIAAMVLLVTLRFPPEIVSLPVHAWRVSLMAPRAIASPTITRPRRLARMRPPRASDLLRPRLAPEPPPPAPARIDPAPIPAAEPVRAEVRHQPPPEVFHEPAHETAPVRNATARTVRTGAFAETGALAPLPSPLTAKPAGFSGVEISPRPETPSFAQRSQNPPTPGGSFESASPPASADRGPVSPGRRTEPAVGGFADTSAVPAASSAGPAISRAAAASGAFGDATVAAPASRRSAAPTPSDSASGPVEILSKPRPVYTREARALQIEGEVLVEIQFHASGEVRILRVVHGLGHGLDESAVASAREILFRPARQSGAPVDSTAIVHIQFQLAY